VVVGAGWGRGVGDRRCRDQLRGCLLVLLARCRERGVAQVAATFLPPGATPQLVNVVEALSIGLGQQPPRLWITDDPTPNAISLRSTRNRDLCVTTGALALPRAELEALCAHELGHLWAEDSHWVTAGLVAVARARRFGEFIVVLGSLGILVVGLAAKYVDVLLWSSAVFSLALIGLGICSKTILRQLELTVRRNADEIADVQAIRLARDPNSLGDVCARLAADERRVSPVQWRSELLWFEAVETAKPNDDVAAIRSSIRSRADLLRRALAAYAEARVPVPASVIDLQQRVASDTARLATLESTRPLRIR